MPNYRLNLRPLRYAPDPDVPRNWRREYLGEWVSDAYSIYKAPYSKSAPAPIDWPKFLKLWDNIGVAHTAAVFMKEVHWNGSEFTNRGEALPALLSGYEDCHP